MRLSAHSESSSRASRLVCVNEWAGDDRLHAGGSVSLGMMQTSTKNDWIAYNLHDRNRYIALWRAMKSCGSMHLKLSQCESCQQDVAQRCRATWADALLQPQILLL